MEIQHDRTYVVYIESGSPSSAFLSAGALPVASLGTESAPQAGEWSVADPDVNQYPKLDDAIRDPRVLRPDLFNYLESADVFLAREGNAPSATVVVRCASHFLTIPYSHVPSVDLHAEAHTIDGVHVFGIYPLLWDDLRDPFYAEATILPYDCEGASEHELAHSLYGLKWRKLFYLLTQQRTTLIIVDENHRVVSHRTVDHHVASEGKRQELVATLQACFGKRLPTRRQMEVDSRYNVNVPIDEVRKRFPSRRRPTLPLGDGEPFMDDLLSKTMKCSGCGAANRLRPRAQRGNYKCARCGRSLAGIPLTVFPLFDAFVDGLTESGKARAEGVREVDGVRELLVVCDKQTYEDSITFLKNQHAARVVLCHPFSDGGAAYVRWDGEPDDRYEFVVDCLATACDYLREFDGVLPRTLVHRGQSGARPSSED